MIYNGRPYEKVAGFSGVLVSRSSAAIHDEWMNLDDKNRHFVEGLAQVVIHIGSSQSPCVVDRFNEHYPEFQALKKEVNSVLFTKWRRIGPVGYFRGPSM